MQRAINAQVQDTTRVIETRERIVRAAIAVFRRKGFHGATTRCIAEEAGVTQSNIYNYVRSKDDILYLVCEHLVGLYSASVDGVMREYVDPYARLINALRGIMAVMFDHRDELVLLYNEVHALQKPDRKLVLKAVARFIRQFQQLLDGYVADGGRLRFSNTRISANLLSFVPAIVALRWWDLSLYSDREEAEQAIFEFILAGLGIPGPGAGT
ncbi:TetR/AcrR family transcriptional regulator [Nitratireductor mangrovi]|uniref:TetR/AcrR family transcriptional regulator n=1 Tax=Nitratireductor mangrovi TaxID=2599600 RepID=A0A5B8KTM0_9HYPH|nr:TetR/AcrR family transcriptional regulator [Nitratireductor mangrovi]QDY98956.2 TetR/AcrR family transcriptional regulator [Nitratireductor mangrovi]